MGIEDKIKRLAAAHPVTVKVLKGSACLLALATSILAAHFAGPLALSAFKSLWYALKHPAEVTAHYLWRHVGDPLVRSLQFRSVSAVFANFAKKLDSSLAVPLLFAAKVITAVEAAVHAVITMKAHAKSWWEAIKLFCRKITKKMANLLPSGEMPLAQAA
jgi:hypothetical protein